jgi:nitroimidazol reductase NimA-like FMN-containing flavoprotein (pyridoxamine 5'-phosphate oxidase superfamily)
MVIHELTPVECRDWIGRRALGRLACAQANQPYITPIFFAFDAGDDCLYSFATTGQKIEWMRDNPRVCVAIDDVSDELNWTTVIVFGRYEELTGTPAHSPALDRARELFEARRSWWLPAAGKLASGEEHGSSVVYRVRIEEATGRRAGVTSRV